MADNLLIIGKSGAMAARSALDVTAQNIANANNPDYVRRSLSLAEVASIGGIRFESSTSLSGVRPDMVLRSNSAHLQSEARRTQGDVSRANAELAGLSQAETAIEKAGTYPAIIEFEASLSRLSSDPLSGPLRAAVVEDARSLAQTFQIAETGLDAAADALRFGSDAGVEQVNLLASELARTNVAIARTRPGSSNMAVLHDQRDALLGDMASLAGITSSFDDLGRATVQIGGEALVTGNQSALLTKTENPDGSFAFAVGGNPATLTSGSLLGSSQAGLRIGDLRGDLDALAVLLMDRTNTAQAAGIAPDGTPGQPFFSGTGAADIAMILDGGSQLATAPAGAGAGSRDISNLQALRDALANNGPAAASDAMLFGLSNAINARTVTRDALATIAETASTSLVSETGVDLDQEAANLLRYQQAFEASGRVIQVAADLFDTILGIR